MSDTGRAGDTALGRVTAVVEFEGRGSQQRLRPAVERVAAAADLSRTFVLRDEQNGTVQALLGSSDWVPPHVDLTDAGSSVGTLDVDALGARAGGLEFTLLRSRPQGCALRIGAPAELADGTALRVLQHAVVDAAAGSAVARLPVEGSLRWAAWQHALLEGAGDAVPVAAPARTGSLAIHRADSSPRRENRRRRLGPAEASRLLQRARDLGVEPGAWVLACWARLLQMLEGAPGELAVAVDARHPPVPYDVAGNLSPARVWWPATHAGAPHRQVAAEAQRWVEQAGERPWRPAAAPSATPVVGFAEVRPWKSGTRAAFRYRLSPPRSEVATVDLLLEAGADETGADLALTFDPAGFAAEDVDGVMESLLALLDRSVDNPASSWRGHALGATVRYAATRHLDPPETLWERVRRQAVTRPEQAAVRTAEATWSYGRLGREAAGLAQALLALGIRPDDRVGVMVDQGPGLVVALLGVLASGAAYVPFTTDEPPARLRRVAEDAGVRAVVTTRRTLGPAPAGVSPVLLDDIAPAAPAGQGEPVLPDGLAYVRREVRTRGGSRGRRALAGVVRPHGDLAAGATRRRPDGLPARRRQRVRRGRQGDRRPGGRDPAEAHPLPAAPIRGTAAPGADAVGP